MPWDASPTAGFTTGRPWLPDGDRAPADTVAVQHTHPGSHLNAVRRLVQVRRWLQVHAPHSQDDVVVADLAAADREAMPVTALRRGRVWVVANLDDVPTGPFALPAPAVYDTVVVTVTPARPRGGTVTLAPRQALLLIEL